MDGGRAKREGPLALDWDKLLVEDGEEEKEPPQLVVVVARKPPESPPDKKIVDGEETNNQQLVLNELRKLSDNELQESVARMRRDLPKLSSTLKDGGEKFKLSLKRHEDELERRRLLCLQKDMSGVSGVLKRSTCTAINGDDGCKEPIEFLSRTCNGLSDDVPDHAPPSLSSPTTFASCFINKLKAKTDSTTVKAFEKELSTLNPCGRHKTQSDRQFLSGGRQKRGFSLRESPFQSPFLNVDNEPLSNSNQNDRRSSPRLQALNRLKRIKGEKTVVLVDEELEVEETTAPANELDQGKNISIYYPSRDDPVSVETICYSDMDCLAPEAYMTSTIMNFYIRYLQVEGLTSKMADMETCNYHFFNTYFYEKLKEALGETNIPKSFAKLRRWWKHVNIFEKAYILLPIHENLHWSLVIVCIPDVEDRSGPIVLHLDSLGLHTSQSIFRNVKSFLIEEWKFLNEREAPLDLPIADTVWENLSSRIDEKIVQVPQQGNDYDCGLFVLFFMKRFIEEAPERLKKKDLARFGRNWFNPEEASSLRQNIRSLLKEKFKNAIEEKQLLDLRL